MTEPIQTELFFKDEHPHLTTPAPAPSKTINFDCVLHALARNDDHETSRMAADSILPSLTKLAMRVYEQIKLHQQDGLTDSEISSLFDGQGLAITTARRRRTDLVKVGLVEASNMRRRNKFGNLETVWVCTQNRMDELI